MEVIRRNTDYGLRMMLILSQHYGKGELLSASRLVRAGNVSPEVGRKLLQILGKAKLLKSIRGTKGGFKLNRKPSEISVLQVMKVLQGEVYLNKCLAKGSPCEFDRVCGANAALQRIQQLLDDELGNLTLEQVVNNTAKKKKKGKTA
jgi:Rrf2 family protein